MNGRLRMHRRRLVRRWLMGSVTATVMAAALTVVPGTAIGVSSASADDGGLRPRLEAACARVPAAEGRLDAAISRLDDDASQRGSLAWFRTAVSRAESNNRPRVATDLQRRLERLTERRAVLDVWRTQLDRLETICAKRNAQG